MPVTHTFVSAKSDGGDATLVRPSNWNADHTLTSMELNVLAVTPSASQNDYGPTGWSDTNPARATVLRIAPSATILLTGLTGGAAGRMAIIVNASTDYMIIVVPQASASTAANRFRHSAAVLPLFLMPGDTATYLYDSTTSRWTLASSTRGAGLNSQLDVFDEFMATTGIFTTATSGTGASGQTGTYLVNSTEKPVGVMQLDTGTGSSGRAYIGAASNNGIVPAQGPAFSLTRMAVEALSDGTNRYQAYAGLHDGSNIVTDGVYWTYQDDVNANWLRGSAAAASRTETASGIAAGTNYIWLGIFINADWTRADYFYSTDSVTWVIDGSNTANMPSSTQLVSVAAGINKTVGTTQRNLSVDLMGFRYDLSRG